MNLIGLKDRYAPARLAIGRSLSVTTMPEPLPTGTERGRSIKGQFLFGPAEIAIWAALIIQRSALDNANEDDIRRLVQAHWHRGMQMLWEDWKSSGNRYEKFLLSLAQQAGMSQDEVKPKTGTQAAGRPVRLSATARTSSGTGSRGTLIT